MPSFAESSARGQASQFQCLLQIFRKTLVPLLTCSNILTKSGLCPPLQNILTNGLSALCCPPRHNWVDRLMDLITRQSGWPPPCALPCSKHEHSVTTNYRQTPGACLLPSLSSQGIFRIWSLLPKLSCLWTFLGLWHIDCVNPT